MARIAKPTAAKTSSAKTSAAKAGSKMTAKPPSRKAVRADAKRGSRATEADAAKATAKTRASSGAKEAAKAPPAKGRTAGRVGARKVSDKTASAQKAASKKASVTKAPAKTAAAKTTQKKAPAKTVAKTAKKATAKAPARKSAAKAPSSRRGVTSKATSARKPAARQIPSKTTTSKSTTAKGAMVKGALVKTSAKAASKKAAAKATVGKVTTKPAAAGKTRTAKATTKASAAKSRPRAPTKSARATAQARNTAAKTPTAKTRPSKASATSARSAKPVAAEAARIASAPRKTGGERRAARKTPRTAGTRPEAPAKPATRAPVRGGTAARKTAAGKPVAGPSTANPFLKPWRAGPGDLPPFDAIRTEHFSDGFAAAMKAHRAEVEAILANPDAPTFENSVRALEGAGALLNQVASVFWNFTGSNADDALQALERDVAPQMSQHWSAITLDPRLFQRVDALWRARETLDLDDEERRVLERMHLDLVRGGAMLDAAGKTRVAAISERLATLTSTFMQNVMKDEQSWSLMLDEADLVGLPEALRASARRAAEDAGQPGGWAITLARSSVEGFLTFSERRDLREQAWRAWTARGDHPGATDNNAVLAEVVALRDEYARLMGFDSYAAFNLDDAMAKTPQAVHDLLNRVWTPAVARAHEEREALAAHARAMGDDIEIEGWDWRYYAEKVRAEKYAFDASSLRPYLSLDAIIAAAFHVANRLFGVVVEERKDAPRYHPDMRVWAVRTANGAPVGAFIGDYFARPGKRSGAWMSSFRTQHKLDGEVRPVIVNVMNFARAGAGEPTLLSFDDARTLFHEFGHALHGLLSDVSYPSISGTSVARDFVELPSQLYEHWLETPEVLERFARHVETGEPMPQNLREKMTAARNFNQGFATVEFTSSALVDMALYSAPDAGAIDTRDFEARALAKIGMPRAIVMRHRLPHFMHIVSGYAAGYYSYMWSEVMDADAFEAFAETGDVFDADVARRLKDHIYAAGNRRDPADAWMAFRGRAPSVEGLLKKRGLVVETSQGSISAPSGDV